MNTTVERVERHPVEVPFREVPARNMARELPHWRFLEVCEVELASGHVGMGETLSYYTWGETTDADVERALGADATGLLWDDSLGAGLQIALFDAVGRALDAPIHELLGSKVRDRAPVSWWCIDMPPEDWAAEAERALEAGYTSLKVKGRPWFDLREQLAALEGTLPRSFDVDVDFNGTLRDAERARGVLEDVLAVPQVSHVEGPIPQEDVAGNRELAAALDVPVALHYGRPEPMTQLEEAMCDGFVVSGGASEVRDAAAVCGTAGTPFWLQLVGTGITAAFSLHCGGVFEGATWPAVNCHQLYEDDLLADSIEVEDGTAPVPDGPGLGHAVDRDALEAYRVEKPEERPNPPRLVECDWPDGPTLYLAEGEVNFVLDYAREGGMPFFERGVTTRLIPDDGSEAWARLHEAAPVEADEPRL
ncbi:MAG: mandelate racemase/muconate lactonizing enzyme family protein [Halobacteriales archaeon]